MWLKLLKLFNFIVSFTIKPKEHLIISGIFKLLVPVEVDMNQFEQVNVPFELQDLIPQFMTYTTVDFQTLKQYFSERNFIGMRQMCHKMLGSVSSFGFEQLHSLLISLQKNLRGEDWILVNDNMRDLERYFLFLDVIFPMDNVG